MKAAAVGISSRLECRASACAPIARASSLAFRNHPSKQHATGSARALASHWVRRGDAAASGSRHALHNARGQRVFKTEPKADQVAPDQSDLGDGFIAWLKKFLSWDYNAARNDASLGTAYVYADATGATGASLPTWAILGEYDNGSANSKGRTEYIWLPTESGNPIPVGVFRNGRLYSISADHLGTPRVMKDDSGKVVWQLPYSAFGDNKPTGPLTLTTNPTQAVTNQPYLLRATTAQELNLRFPGQYWDSETGLHYNFHRSYQATQGRYTQPDPIGLDGGINRYFYVEGNPLDFDDPFGLKCTARQHIFFQLMVNAACKWSGDRACLPSDSCNTNQIKLAKNSACASARRIINKKCFNGGDKGHQEAEANAIRAIEICKKYRDECCRKKPDDK